MVPPLQLGVPAPLGLAHPVIAVVGARMPRIAERTDRAVLDTTVLATRTDRPSARRLLGFVLDRLFLAIPLVSVHPVLVFARKWPESRKVHHHALGDCVIQIARFAAHGFLHFSHPLHGVVHAPPWHDQAVFRRRGGSPASTTARLRVRTWSSAPCGLRSGRL